MVQFTSWLYGTISKQGNGLFAVWVLPKWLNWYGTWIAFCMAIITAQDWDKFRNIVWLLIHERMISHIFLAASPLNTTSKAWWNLFFEKLMNPRLVSLKNHWSNRWRQSVCVCVMSQLVIIIFVVFSYFVND